MTVVEVNDLGVNISLLSKPHFKIVLLIYGQDLDSTFYNEIT